MMVSQKKWKIFHLVPNSGRDQLPYCHYSPEVMENKLYMLAVDIGSTNIKARIYNEEFKVQASNSKQVFYFLLQCYIIII